MKTVRRLFALSIALAALTGACHSRPPARLPDPAAKAVSDRILAAAIEARHSRDMSATSATGKDKAIMKPTCVAETVKGFTDTPSRGIVQHAATPDMKEMGTVKTIIEEDYSEAWPSGSRGSGGRSGVLDYGFVEGEDRSGRINIKHRPGGDRGEVNRVVRQRMQEILISVSFDDTPLPDVVTYLREYSRLNILIDEERIDPTVALRVTLSADRQPVRDVLDEILDQCVLRYVIDNGTIIITTRN